MAFETTTIRRALADHLHELRLIAAVTETGEGFDPDETLPVPVWGKLPAAPDDAVAINIYNRLNVRDKHNPDVYVQLRFRTGGEDSGRTEDLADAVFNALDDRSKFTMGGVRVLLCTQKIRGLATPDTNGRYERPDSYLFVLNPIGDT